TQARNELDPSAGAQRSDEVRRIDRQESVKRLTADGTRSGDRAARSCGSHNGGRGTPGRVDHRAIHIDPVWEPQKSRRKDDVVGPFNEESRCAHVATLQTKIAESCVCTIVRRYSFANEPERSARAVGR